MKRSNKVDKTQAPAVMERPANQEITMTLSAIGLSGTEIKTYLALLDLGEAKTGQILTTSGLSSGKIYEILEALKRKGLVSETLRDGVKRFSPADPRRLSEYLQERQHAMVQQELALQAILPALLARTQMTKHSPHIEIYTGINGLKAAFYKEFDVAKKDSVLYVMGIIGEKNYSKSIFDFFIHNMKSRREKLGLQIKKLLGEDARGTLNAHESQSELRYLPYGSTLSVNVVEDLTIIAIFAREPVIITVESADVAQSFKEQFEMLWRLAKK